MTRSSTRPTSFSTHSTFILILILLILLASFDTNVNVNSLPALVHVRPISTNDALIRRSPQLDSTAAAYHRNPHSPYISQGSPGCKALHVDEVEDGNVRGVINGDRKMVKRSLSELFSRLYDDHLFSGWRRERRWGSSKQANNEIEQEYEEIDDDYYPGDEDLDQEDDDDDDDDEQVFFGIQQTYGQEDDNADEVVELEDDEDEYVNEGMMLIEPISPSQSLFGDEDDDDDDDNDQAGDKNIGYTPKNDNDAYFGRSRRQALHSPQPKIITTEPQMDWVVDEWDEDLDGIEAMDELMDWFEGADHIKPDSASAPRPPIVASSGSQSISSISKSSTIIRRGGRRSSNGMRDQGAATDDTPGAIFVYTSPFRRLFTRPWHF